MTLTAQTSQSPGTVADSVSQYSNSPLATRSTSEWFVPSFLGVSLDPLPCISSAHIAPPLEATPMGSDLDGDLAEPVCSIPAN